MAKRDRWASSSDEDEDGNDGKKRKAPNAATAAASTTRVGAGIRGNSTPSSPPPPTTTSGGNRSFLQQIPLHNPLLQGCRSVYNTYDRIARLSEGAYGIVWKAKDLTPPHDIVALKQIKIEDSCQKIQGFPVTALREINILMALQHENIVTVKEMVVGNGMDKIFMVMEYMELDLQAAMEGKKYPNLLRQGELKGILQQILNGLNYMHSKWFLHRDMKTSNVLVHKTGRVALCDLGLARRFQDPPGKLTQLVVTLWYRAPELLFGEDRYTPAIDMWSVGCIFGELIHQEAIMQGQGELDQIDKIFIMVGAPTDESWPGFKSLPSATMFRWRATPHDKLVKLRELFPINAPPHSKQTFLDGNGFDLLSKLLILDPKKRISAKDALQHPYFKKGVPPGLPNFFDDGE